MNLGKLKNRLVKKHRLRIGVLARMPKGGICAEIGVWKGEFSCRIRRITKPRELHLIDPWTWDKPRFPHRRWNITKEEGIYGQEAMDRIYSNVKERFKNCPDIFIHRDKSEVVLPTFPDGYFDWVYVDGNHGEAFVIRDLDLCYMKVKDDGWIVGDDYGHTRYRQQPVANAVNSFVDKHDLSIEVVGKSQFLIRRK